MEDKINTDPDNWLEINKKSWDTRTDIHIDSKFYDVLGFKNNKNSLHGIELDLLGDVKNKNILHLQCHFGLDSLSLEVLGANVTGVDFSEKAIAYAEKLKKELQLNTTFLCENVYDLESINSKPYEIVFSSYGIVGWLPDLKKWAEVINKQLEINGKFILVDFHPALWMFDDDFKAIEYSYFNDKPYIEIENGSYANREEKKEMTSIWWSHSLSEIMTAFLEEGLVLSEFKEFDYSPFDCFKQSIKIAKDKYRIKHLEQKLPMVYGMVFQKK